MELRQTNKTKKYSKTTRKREELESESYVLGGNFSKIVKNENMDDGHKFKQNGLDVTFTKPSTLSPNSSMAKSKSADNNIHKNHRSRLKQQFLNSGLESLSDVQKVELLLFHSIPLRDTNPIAHALLKKYGSIKEILTANFDSLIQVDGVKESSALLIKLVNGLINYIELPNEKPEFIHNTSDARAYCTKFYHGVDVEQFYVVCLTKANRVKSFTKINAGAIDEVNVQIREITQFAIHQNCTRIVVCHNHPTGSALFSDEDIRFTFSLLCSCLLNNIDIIDHVIVARDFTTCSFEDCGLMDRLKQRASDNVVLTNDIRLIISENKKAYIASNPITLDSIDIENILKSKR